MEKININIEKVIKNVRENNTKATIIYNHTNRNLKNTRVVSDNSKSKITYYIKICVDILGNLD